MRLNFITFSLIVFALIFSFIMFPFWKPVLWGIVIAIVFYPLYLKINRFLKSKNLSSAITTLIVLIIVALPVTFAVLIMVNETEKFISNIDSIKNAFQGIVNKMHNISRLKILAPWIDKIDNSVFSLIQNAGILLTKNIGVVFSQTYSIVANFLFSFIVAFYLIKDGDNFINYMASAVKDKENFKKVLSSIRKSINVTVVGGVLTAFVQGLVGAIGFLIVGLNAFFMWMFLIALFSFMPLVGTSIIWVPVSVYFFIIGNYFNGIFIAIWGVLAIGMVDNYIRPLIIGSKMNIHPMLLFFAILGAIFEFGFVGIIIGPVVIAVSDVLVKSYIESIR